MIEYVDQVLTKINDAKSVDERRELLKKYGAQVPYNMLLSLNFTSVKLDVPDGDPPWTRKDQQHPDMFPTTLARGIRSLQNIVHGRTTLPKMKREHIFIQLLENVPPKEADVLLACKDKRLQELYPNITRELVGSVFEWCKPVEHHAQV